MKTNDLRPCDLCKGSISPIFYQVKVSLRQLLIDQAEVNRTLGTAAILGGNMQLATLMSSDREAAIELPGYQIDKEWFLCSGCLLGLAKFHFTIDLAQLMAEAETFEVDASELLAEEKRK